MAAQHKRPGRAAKIERIERAARRPKRIAVVWVGGKDTDNISPGRLAVWGEIVEVAV